MAESFSCRGEWVHFSNGAVESLFEAWERLALARSAEPGMPTLAAFLRRSLDHDGPGCRAFGLDREFMPDGLSGPAEIAALRSVIDQTAEDPTLIPDVNWSPALIDSWRERLIKMSETMRDQSLPSG